MSLNQQGLTIVDDVLARREELQVSAIDRPGTRIVDFGVKSVGSIEAGLRLADICFGGSGLASIQPGQSGVWNDSWVHVATDAPVAACMASQYAGWQLTGEKFFAMGSGPMRAAGSSEKLFDEIGCRERPDKCVGVLETSKIPPIEVCEKIAAACGIAPENLTLCIARTASIAGTLQIVARSVETAMHKMHELGFDLKNVRIGFGSAPLPPVGADDLTALGRTNDAILYGGDVKLWVSDDDDKIAELGPKIPSSASSDYGRPFAEIFERYDRDFYKIDPLLFSPAAIRINNLTSGRTFSFGSLNAEILAQSFGR